MDRRGRAAPRISRQGDQNRARAFFIFFSFLLSYFCLFIPPRPPLFFFPLRQTRPRKYEIPRACRITIHRGDGYHHAAGRVRDDLGDAMASRSRGEGGVPNGVLITNAAVFAPPFVSTSFRPR